MPTELPFINEPTQKVEEPVRKSDKEVFDMPDKSNVKMDIQKHVTNDGTEISFPQTARPPDAIEIKKKGKPRGHAKDPEKMKEHMAKMRAKSAETRARKKAEKSKKNSVPLPTINEQTPVPKAPPPTPVENPQHSQPVDATDLHKKLAELEKQNNAYKNWYQQNKHHLNKIPAQQEKPAEYKNVNQSQVVYDNRSRASLDMNKGLDRLSNLEAMIRKDEREKLLKKQKEDGEEQAKNLANNRNKMPAGLRKWQSLPAQQHYANNVDMWSKCFEPK